MSALNMERLSIALGVSLPTLRRWLLIYGDEFPVVRRGSNGRAYEFDLPTVSAFLDAKREARKLAAERQTADTADQLAALQMAAFFKNKRFTP